MTLSSLLRSVDSCTHTNSRLTGNGRSQVLGCPSCRGKSHESTCNGTRFRIQESGRAMTIKAHTHDLTLRALAGANASGTGPFLFHQLLTWHAFPQLRKRQEPEAPEPPDGAPAPHPASMLIHNIIVVNLNNLLINFVRK